MTVDDASPLGDLLRARRLAARLTQEALAEIAGISARAIADLERGVIRAPRRDTLELLSAALRLTPDERREWEQLRARLSIRAGSTRRDTVLPQPPNELVGRDRDVEALVNLITHAGSRLVTISGPGGVGKTRVALTAGHTLSSSFRDGVVFIELASIREPDLLIPVIAQHLGLRDGSVHTVRKRLRAYLSQRRLLLILDNVEQLLMAAPELSTLLASSTGLRILVTSRAPLRIQPEQEYPLMPLKLPDWETVGSETVLGRYPSIELFVLRARQVRPDFRLTAANAPAIAAICSHLDGLPLAIELAAARIKVLSPQEMLPRLVNRLAFLTGGPHDVPDRHRTMRGAIAWSYDLLSPVEMQLFRQLSSFTGGWTFDAAEAVASSGIDLLDSLVSLADNNLIRQVIREGGRSRYTMLETIREFGVERLEEMGEVDQAREAHARYFLHLTEQAEPEMRGPKQVEWLSRLGDELANLRSALEWSHRQETDSELPVRLAGALAMFWESRGYVSEGRGWLDRSLARERVSDPVRMKALSGAGWLAHIQRDSEAARRYLFEALDLARDLDDQAAAGWILHLLGRVAYFDGDPATAREFGRRSLEISNRIGDDWLRAWVYHLLALAAHIDGDNTTARDFYEASLEIREVLGYREGIGTVTGLLGMLSLREGDYDTALAKFHTSLTTIRELGSRWLAINMIANLVTIAAKRGDLERAARLSGFVGAMTEVVGAAPIPLAEAAYREGLAALGEYLSEDDYARWRSDGEKMSFAEAIAEALAVGTASPTSTGLAGDQASGSVTPTR